MNAYIDAVHLWLPPLPTDPRAIPLTAGLRPNAAVMPAFDPTIPVAAWARTSLQFHADPVQAEILNEPARRLILCCSSQWGKSTVAAIKALHLAWRKPGALILFTAACFNQSAELLRKFRQYAGVLTGTRCKGDGVHPASIVLPNGSRILALPQSPYNVRCYSAVDLIVVDQAAYVAGAMYYALSPMLAASRGELWLLSTPFERTGEFYKVWTGNDPEWRRWSVTAAQCDRISPAFLASERLAKGETQFNRDYMCQFLDTRKQAIDPKDIEAAFCGDYPAMQFPD